MNLRRVAASCHCVRTSARTSIWSKVNIPNQEVKVSYHVKVNGESRSESVC